MSASIEEANKLAEETWKKYKGDEKAAKDKYDAAKKEKEDAEKKAKERLRLPRRPPRTMTTTTTTTTTMRMMRTTR